MSITAALHIFCNQRSKLCSRKLAVKQKGVKLKSHIQSAFLARWISSHDDTGDEPYKTLKDLSIVLVKVYEKGHEKGGSHKICRCFYFSKRR